MSKAVWVCCAKWLQAVVSTSVLFTSKCCMNFWRFHETVLCCNGISLLQNVWLQWRLIPPFQPFSCRYPVHLEKYSLLVLMARSSTSVGRAYWWALTFTIVARGGRGGGTCKILVISFPGKNNLKNCLAENLDFWAPLPFLPLNSRCCKNLTNWIDIDCVPYEQAVL